MAAPLPKVPKHLMCVQQLWMPASCRSWGGDPTSWVTESELQQHLKAGVAASRHLGPK